MNKITINKPDDWHLHLRNGKMMENVVGYSANAFARGLIMPNLVPPVVNAKQAKEYKDSIIRALPEGNSFEPLMTLYLTENTSGEDIQNAVDSGVVVAVKMYPAGATTNSDSGVRDFGKIIEVLQKMSEVDMPLCVHGEVVDAGIDIFDREKVFIEKVLEPIRQQVPKLRVVMEHITTQEGVEYVKNAENTAGTITLHHLVLNRNHLLAGGIKPHYYCLPIVKREKHRVALMETAVSGNSKFFLGTDSAPHAKHDKESECGCAGCFTAINTMPILTQIFDNENKLDRLEDFTAKFGAQFYKRKINEEKINLIKLEKPVKFPESIGDGEHEVVVFDPMFDVFWEMEK